MKMPTAASSSLLRGVLPTHTRVIAVALLIEKKRIRYFANYHVVSMYVFVTR